MRGAASAVLANYPSPQPSPRRGEGVSKELSMKIGLIGLGRMGGNIARRLMKDGHEVVA